VYLSASNDSYSKYRLFLTHHLALLLVVGTGYVLREGETYVLHTEWSREVTFFKV